MSCNNDLTVGDLTCGYVAVQETMPPQMQDAIWKDKTAAKLCQLYHVKAISYSGGFWYNIEGGISKIMPVPFFKYRIDFVDQMGADSFYLFNQRRI